MTEQCKFCKIEQIHLPWPICREKNECAGSVVNTSLGMAPLRVEGMRCLFDTDTPRATYASLIAQAAGPLGSAAFIEANNAFLDWVDGEIAAARAAAVRRERNRVRRLKRKKFPTKRGK